MVKLAFVVLLLGVVADVLSNVIIESPPVNNLGDWGPWEHCLPGDYAVGFQLKTERWLGPLDDTAMNGIKLFCGTPGEEANEGLHSVSSTVGDFGVWGTLFGCDGVLNGFQFRSEAPGNADDTAANNMRGFCSASTNFVEGDGLIFGDWTASQHCETKQAVCGLQVQVQPWQQGEDDTSLNNLRAECCDVEDPAAICTPSDNLQFIISCDNSAGDLPLACAFGYTFGLAYVDTDSVTEAYESLGFPLDEAGNGLSENYGVNYGVSPITAYNWTGAPSGTWTPETTAQETIIVEPGTISQIYQVYGTCGIYSASTNSFREVINKNGVSITRKFKV